MKTKRVDSVDLSASAFAYVGDPEDTGTWKLPIHFPADAAKTRNHVKDALYRFDQTKGIPDPHRDGVRLILVGAALAHGIDVEDFRAPLPPVRKAEPTQEPSATERPLLSEKELKELTALADHRAELFLKQLGLE